MSSRVQHWPLPQLRSPAAQWAPILYPSALHSLLEVKDATAGSAAALGVQRGSYLVYTLRVQFMVTKEACPDLPAIAGSRKCTLAHSEV